jgi:uncharacterized membrane protein
MWETETAINIAAPVETVYEYLADFPRHSEWSTGVEELAPVSKGPVTVGMELEATEKVPARFTSYTRITGLEPGRRITRESWDGRTMKVKWAFELSPRNGGTHLVQHARVEPTSLMGRVLLPLFASARYPTRTHRVWRRLRQNSKSSRLAA